MIIVSGFKQSEKHLIKCKRTYAECLQEYFRSFPGNNILKVLKVIPGKNCL